MQVLYVSRNQLQSLQGIHQFPELSILSAAYNPIKHLGALEKLRDATPLLKNASFLGCPVANIINYRSHAIVCNPKISKLDGLPVTKSDRELAHEVVEQEEVTMRVMIHNACVVHKLVRSVEI